MCGSHSHSEHTSCVPFRLSALSHLLSYNAFSHEIWSRLKLHNDLSTKHLLPPVPGKEEFSCPVSSLPCCPALCLFSGLAPRTEIPGQPFRWALFHSFSSSEVSSGLMPPCSPSSLSACTTCCQIPASKTFTPASILAVPHLDPIVFLCRTHLGS